MTIYARVSHDPTELRLDGLWAAILKSTADQGRGLNALYYALRNPEQSRNKQKAKIIYALRAMSALGLVIPVGPIQSTRKGRQALAALERQHA